MHDDCAYVYDVIIVLLIMTVSMAKCMLEWIHASQLLSYALNCGQVFLIDPSEDQSAWSLPSYELKSKLSYSSVIGKQHTHQEHEEIPWWVCNLLHVILCKFGLRISSNSITYELVWNADFWTTPQL